MTQTTTRTVTARRALWGATAACWTAAALASLAVLADLIPSPEALAARSYLRAVDDGLVRDLH